MRNHSSTILFLLSVLSAGCGSKSDSSPSVSDGGKQEVGEDATPPPVADAAAAVAAPEPFFLQHWSDTQIGSGGFAHPAFSYLLNEVRPAFGSIPIVLTGDLVENGNDTDSWRTYRDLVDGAGLNASTFIEVPGNHDAYPFGSLSNYDSFSVAGRSGNGRYGITDLDSAGRHIRIIGVNTAGGNIVQLNTGYVRSSEIDELIGAVQDDPRVPDATLVIGHHSMDDPESLPLLGTDDDVQRLLDATDAMAYLFGHRHIYATHWADSLLMSQASTVGNPADNILANGEAGFTLFAIDEQGPVVKHVGFLGDAETVHANWPIVMITTPVNPRMTVDAQYDDLAYPPVASPLAGLPRDTADQVVRVGVFDNEAIERVVLQIDGGDAVDMVLTGNHYEARFRTPNAASCEVRVTATTASGSNVDAYDIDLSP